MTRPDIEVAPYCEVDGIRTFTDTFIAGIYARMIDDGVADLVFYDGSVRSPKAFVDLLKGSVSYVIFLHELPAGVAWINRLQSRWGQFNFCCFSHVWGRDSVAVGRYAVKTLIHQQDNQGTYIWDAFLGIMPVCNTYACGYVLKCGGKKIGVLPNGCWFADEKISKDALLVSYTREDAG